jgi:hypothetical protein
MHGTQKLVEAGTLVDVMPALRAAPMPVSLLYPNRRHLAPRIQAILNWVTHVIGRYLASAKPLPEEMRAQRAKRMTPRPKQ